MEPVSQGFTDGTDSRFVGGYGIVWGHLNLGGDEVCHSTAASLFEHIFFPLNCNGFVPFPREPMPLP